MPRNQSHLPVSMDDFEEEKIHLDRSVGLQQSHRMTLTQKKKFAKYAICVFVVAVFLMVILISKNPMGEKVNNGASQSMKFTQKPIFEQNKNTNIQNKSTITQNKHSVTSNKPVLEEQQNIENKDKSTAPPAINLKNTKTQTEHKDNKKVIEVALNKQTQKNTSHPPKNDLTRFNSKELQKHLQIRKKKFQARHKIYTQRFSQKLMSQAKKRSQVTFAQLLNAIQLIAYTGQTNQNDNQMLKAYLRERDYYEEKYNISKYEEKPFCIIVPTYLNFKGFRYYYNIDSIFSQNYTNFRAIFIDDNSNDSTGKAIQAYLKNKNISPQKATVIINRQRKFHMENIYNAVHNFCKPGQIGFTIDGDDQLIGRQVFKLFNAVYHQKQAYSAYSNHLQVTRQITMQIGSSSAYPKEIMESNTFRIFQGHSYSHLRSFAVDLFLAADQQSFKNSDGNWFNNSVDNAIFFSIFEMSCKKIEYIPQIVYKYNIGTGLNYATWQKSIRNQTAREIQKKKVYTCIDDQRVIKTESNGSESLKQTELTKQTRSRDQASKGKADNDGYQN